MSLPWSGRSDRPVSSLCHSQSHGPTVCVCVWGGGGVAWGVQAAVIVDVFALFCTLCAYRGGPVSAAVY